eukprot:gnl/MRDRNA2_/MRDRNA2_240936_c0_seq1.p1 gnl/MRDRNA2_/MRDRNA2_240936_c0~~gnl/MRDRNA2_/MRDRNA2_240936_c0_seq1.p1  ORF type:complete len:122 (-),score=27.91 gnl/MRDRNA2_/MRDRNA2_240936_c0_seq1:139-504(-)
MNKYETVFIVTPVLSDDQVAETVDKFKKFVESNDGKVTHQENWGLRKLAYPIQNKTTGFYHLMEFEVPGEAIGPMEVEYRRDERIIRFLTTKMDKHHMAWAEKRKKKIKEGGKKEVETKDK